MSLEDYIRSQKEKAGERLQDAKERAEGAWRDAKASVKRTAEDVGENFT